MNHLGSALRHIGMLVLALLLLIPQGGIAATDVTPAQPAITGSTCIDDEFTPPSVTFGPTTGITYGDVELHRDPYVANSYNSRGTATLEAGFTWAAEWGDGWQQNGSDERTLTYVGSIETLLCDADVVLAQPTVAGNTCTDGDYTPPSVTFGPTTGVTYGDVTVTEQPDGDYTVEASAWMDEGFGNGSLETGWSGFRSALDFRFEGAIERVTCQQDESPSLEEQLVAILIQILQELLGGSAHESWTDSV